MYDIYSRLFAVKQYRCNINHIDREKFLKMINKYLKSWGMNKIICLKRVRKRVNKKRVDYPDLYEYCFKNKYNLTYQEPLTECMISVDIDD